MHLSPFRLLLDIVNQQEGLKISKLQLAWIQVNFKLFIHSTIRTFSKLSKVPVIHFRHSLIQRLKHILTASSGRLDLRRKLTDIYILTEQLLKSTAAKDCMNGQIKTGGRMIQYRVMNFII